MWDTSTTEANTLQKPLLLWLARLTYTVRNKGLTYSIIFKEKKFESFTKLRKKQNVGGKLIKEQWKSGKNCRIWRGSVFSMSYHS